MQQPLHSRFHLPILILTCGLLLASISPSHAWTPTFHFSGQKTTLELGQSDSFQVVVRDSGSEGSLAALIERKDPNGAWYSRPEVDVPGRFDRVYEGVWVRKFTGTFTWKPEFPGVYRVTFDFRAHTGASVSKSASYELVIDNPQKNLLFQDAKDWAALKTTLNAIVDSRMIYEPGGFPTIHDSSEGAELEGVPPCAITYPTALSKSVQAPAHVRLEFGTSALYSRQGAVTLVAWADSGGVYRISAVKNIHDSDRMEVHHLFESVASFSFLGNLGDRVATIANRSLTWINRDANPPDFETIGYPTECGTSPIAAWLQFDGTNYLALADHALSFISEDDLASSDAARHWQTIDLPDHVGRATMIKQLGSEQLLIGTSSGDILSWFRNRELESAASTKDPLTVSGWLTLDQAAQIDTRLEQVVEHAIGNEKDRIPLPSSERDYYSTNYGITGITAVYKHSFYPMSFLLTEDLGIHQIGGPNGPTGHIRLTEHEAYDMKSGSLNISTRNGWFISQGALFAARGSLYQLNGNIYRRLGGIDFVNSSVEPKNLGPNGRRYGWRDDGLRLAHGDYHRVQTLRNGSWAIGYSTNRREAEFVLVDLRRQFNDRTNGWYHSERFVGPPVGVKHLAITNAHGYEILTANNGVETYVKLAKDGSPVLHGDTAWQPKSTPATVEPWEILPATTAALAGLLDGNDTALLHAEQEKVDEIPTLEHEDDAPVIDVKSFLWRYRLRDREKITLYLHVKDTRLQSVSWVFGESSKLPPLRTSSVNRSEWKRHVSYTYRTGDKPLLRITAVDVHGNESKLDLKLGVDGARTEFIRDSAKTGAGLSVNLAPKNPAVAVGDEVTFTAEVSGADASVTYAWFHNDVQLTGEDKPSLVLKEMTAAEAGNYQVKVTAGGKTVPSSKTELTVIAPPVIVKQPSDTTVRIGSSAQFEVEFKGHGRLDVQWFKDGAVIPEAKESKLTIAEVTQDAEVHVEVSNTRGTATSRKAMLTVGTSTTSEIQIHSSKQVDKDALQLVFRWAGSVEGLALSISADNGQTYQLAKESEMELKTLAAGIHYLRWKPASISDFPDQASRSYRMRITIGTASKLSDAFVVDVRPVRLVDVSGRVVDASGNPFPNATVTLASLSVITGTDGKFVFTGLKVSDGLNLNVAASGHYSVGRTLQVEAGVRALVEPDISLEPIPVNPVPVISDLQTDLPGGIFVQGLDIEETLSITVDWRGATPEKVVILVNDNPVGYTTEMVNGVYLYRLNTGSTLVPSYHTPNQVSVMAISASGTASKIQSLSQHSLPASPGLRWICEKSVSRNLFKGDIHIHFAWPPEPWAGSGDIGFFGKLKSNFQWAGTFSYDALTQEYELGMGAGYANSWKKRGRRPKFPGITKTGKLYMGNKEFELRGYLLEHGRATLHSGISIGQPDFRFTLDFDGELGRYSVFKFHPGMAAWARGVPRLSQELDRLRLAVHLVLSAEAVGKVKLSPFEFGPGEVHLKINPSVRLMADLSMVKIWFEVGGNGGVTFGFPDKPYFRRAVGSMYFCAHAQGGTFELEILNYEWEFLKGPRQANSLPSLLVQPEFRPLNRDYRKRGTGGFAPSQARVASSLQPSAMAKFRSFSASSVASQADLRLVNNEFPDPSPALAVNGDDLLLMYVADNGSENPIQFTSIQHTRLGGNSSSWSVPKRVDTDPRSSFDPEVRFDGQGRAVAVWYQVGETNLNGGLQAMSEQWEIVTSFSDTSGETWQTPKFLTTNSVTDHSPQLAGPLANGDLVLTWIRNPHNDLDAGVEHPDQIWSVRWSAATATCSAPVMLMEQEHITSWSVAAHNDTVVLAFTSDDDGLYTTTADQHLFYKAASPHWDQAPIRVTDNVLGANRNVKAAFVGDELQLYWISEGDLVSWGTESDSITTIRKQVHGVGDQSHRIIPNADGKVALIWPGMSSAGPDAFYKILDPTSGTWSKEAPLFSSAEAELDLQAVWEGDTLTMAYQVRHPQGDQLAERPQVDLAVTRRRLVQDVAVSEFGLLEGELFAGETVTLQLSVTNGGDCAIKDAQLSVVHGETTITNLTLEGWIPGHDTRTIPVTWVVPEVVSGSLTASVVATGLTESDTENNSMDLPLGKADAVLSLRRPRLEAADSFEVMTTVHNHGTTPIEDAVVKLLTVDGAQLSQRQIPLLDPNDQASVLLTAPPSSLFPGTNRFLVSITWPDDAQDADPSDNQRQLEVIHAVDSDGDKLPDYFESQHAHSATVFAADGDADKDGMTNLQEFRAGTDPRDPNSRLLVRSSKASNGRVVLWPAEPGRSYSLQRASSVTGPFTTIARHLTRGTEPEIEFSDSEEGNGLFFYRIIAE